MTDSKPRTSEVVTHKCLELTGSFQSIKSYNSMKKPKGWRHDRICLFFFFTQQKYEAVLNVIKNQEIYNSVILV